MPLHNKIKKVIVIGSGPIIIGQAAEFDYAGTQACLALKEEGITVILVNNNPATIMTDQTIADKVYMEPLTVETIEMVIKKEQPDGFIGTLGGQTGLNLTVQLYEKGIFQKYKIELLGTPVDSIQKGEDREKFRQLMLDISEPVPESKIVHNYEEGLQFAKQIGYPVIIRPAYTLGGEGGGFATNDAELEIVVKKGISLSPIHQVLIERSIKGWKEIEYEVMRDKNDTCIIVCNMENFDPVGVHTGDSIVVAPSQTLSDVQYQILRNASLKIIRALNIIGGCNIQFALDPRSNNYYIIEVNPRVSRSSALASKATGYPIARMAAKCAIGYHLDELINPITGNTFASFEPALDYIVVKLPRFPFDKFSEADRSLGTQMKATGEVMAIDRSFEGALNKALRSLEMNVSSLRIDSMKNLGRKELVDLLCNPSDLRLFAISEAIWQGMGIGEICQYTQIDQWFLNKIQNIVRVEQLLAELTWENVPIHLLKKAKQMNISDKCLSDIYQIHEKDIRKKWRDLAWRPGFKQVDTCAAEFEAITPYYYSTWSGTDEVVPTDRKKIMVIGSGPIRIGQGIEFDYCSVQATIALKKKGYEAIVINNNPETVSTDYSIADRLYFEPLAVEDILHVIEKENPEGVLIQFGGQTAINLANSLKEEGVNILGTTVESIEQLEDRQQFYALLKQLQIPHIEGEIAHYPDELILAASKLGYPVLVRPSYVIGGQSMFIINKEEEMNSYINRLKQENDSRLWPLLVDRYIPGIECEIDVISDGTTVVIPGIFEHVERAGVHSGDSITVFPPISLSKEQKQKIVQYAEKIAETLPIIGMMNIQYVCYEQEIYVLEVNPRSSRTIPIMSKVTGVPMVKWAVNVQLGDSLCNLSDQNGLLPEPRFYSVKAPVFSAGKLKGVDHALSPEMKSTGEVLGLGMTLQEAMKKAICMEGKEILQSYREKPYILCSISDRHKQESMVFIQQLAHHFQIVATEGTANFLLENGIPVEKLLKSKNDLYEIVEKGNISMIINLPNQGRNNKKVGFYLRELAVRFQIPCFTNLDTAQNMFSIYGSNKQDEHILPIAEYQHNIVKS